MSLTRDPTAGQTGGRMLSAVDNERITRVGAGTPMGDVMRCYWQPAALSSELPEPDGAPLRVRLLGEDLIAFRDTRGSVGLVSAYCPHRRAPMFFGRNEDYGLRCVYHGWKFNVTGACVDMPSEPADSLFKTKMSIPSYPVWEGGGIVWAYLGARETMPGPPDFEFMRAPDSHRFISKTFEECNWLQALEGGLDTSHSSFLHSPKLNDKTQPRNADTAPRLEVEKTDYGFRYAGIRSVGMQNYVRLYQYVLPAQQMRGWVLGWDGKMQDIPTLHGHIWVPIDDERTWVFNWLYSYDPAIPVTPEHALDLERRDGRHPDELLPGFRPKRNKANDYMIDRESQRYQTPTGILGVNTQDYAMQEGMGPIVDRSREHLGTSDRAIIATRQLLMETVDQVEQGILPRGTAPETYRSVRAVDLFVPREVRWQDALEVEALARF
jgi:nitrite reductase/ring-hydroxylating ferredoxin subunit